MDSNSKKTTLIGDSQNNANHDDQDQSKKTTLIGDNFSNVSDDDGSKTIDLSESLNNKNNKLEVDIDTTESLKAGESIDDIILIKRLVFVSGESEIYDCEYKKKQYYFKFYKPGFELSNEIVKLLNTIDSPYLLKPVHTGFYLNRFYEVVPFMKSGSLELNSAIIDLKFIKTILIPNMNEALHALHKVNLAHNDIKPENIFLSDDKKSVILGDFGILNKFGSRKSRKITLEYAAPEADERSTSMVDYFAFGMTIYRLANKENPFEGMKPSHIRSMITDGDIVLNNEIDFDLKNLIYGLIDSPSERFDYDEINFWLKDPSAVKKHRKLVINEGLRIREYEFNKESFTFTYPLTIAMKKAWKKGLEHFKNGFLQDKIKDSSPDTYLIIKEIESTFAHDVEKAFNLVLLTINPTLSLTINGLDFLNFKELILYLTENFPRIDLDVVDKELLMKFAENNNLNQEKMDSLNLVYSHMKKPIEIAEMIINFFNPETQTIYFNGKKYPSYKAFTESLWDNALNPIEHPFINQGHFLTMLNSRIKDASSTLEISPSYQKNNNKFMYYLSLSKLLNNGTYLIPYGTKVYEGFNGFIHIAMEYYLSNDKSSFKNIDFLYQDQLLLEVYKLENNDSKIIDQLSTIYNQSSQFKDNNLAFAYFISSLYFRFSPDSSYIIGNNKATNLEEIIHIVSSSSNLENTAEIMTKDITFLAFLNALGYEGHQLSILTKEFTK